MGEKIFYVINLDKNRIGLLSLLLFGLLFSFFFLGVSIGRGNTKLAKSQIAAGYQLADASKDSKEGMNASEQNTITSEVDSNASSSVDGNSDNSSAFASSSDKSNSSINDSQETNSSPEAITLANKAPNSGNSQAQSSNIVDLQTKNSENLLPSENTKRQENLHSQQSNPNISYSKKTPKKSSTVTSTQTGIYTIQVAAFTDKSVADTYAQKINSENPRLKVKAFVKKRGRNYLVRLGADNSKDQLRKLVSILKLDSKIRKSAIIVNNS